MKKLEKELEEEVIEEVAAPTPLAYDFGREDLNAMQAAVNYLLAKGE
jgi:hypothetical protein